MKGIDHDAIVRKMVGRDIARLEHNRTPAEAAGELLSIDALSWHAGGKQLLKNISFSLRRGEVLGIFGLMGAGRTELLECILGLHAGEHSGDMHLNGVSLDVRSPRDAIRAGVVLVPEDRKKDGLIPGLDVKTNISLSILRSLGPNGLLNNKAERKLAEHYKDSLRIKTPNLEQQVRHLSGGNQQKVILARCLATNPKVLMLDEPTRGIDVHAKNEIYKLILELAESGLGIIVVSSELPEILTVSDRILVFCEGKISATFLRAAANEDDILKAAIPKNI